MHPLTRPPAVVRVKPSFVARGGRCGTIASKNLSTPRQWLTAKLQASCFSGFIHTLYHWLWRKAFQKGPAIFGGASKIVELEILEFLSRRTGEIWFCPIGRFTKWDGASASHAHSVEIKFEAKAAETMNLCFEYSYSGKPSGLMATEAKHWIHSFPVPGDGSRIVCLEFDAHVLRECLKPLPLFRGGDGGKSRVKLLPILEAEKLRRDRFEIKIDWNQFRPYWTETAA